MSGWHPYIHTKQQKHLLMACKIYLYLENVCKPATAFQHFYKWILSLGFEVMSKYHIKRGEVHRYSDFVITAPYQQQSLSFVNFNLIGIK
jgi:hypothetical protein